MNPKVYADEDGTATEQSQLQYQYHTRCITTAIKVLAWLGLGVNSLERLNIWKNTLWVSKPHLLWFPS